MFIHSDRRATPQSAKRGPPFGVAAGSLSVSVTFLDRATSPLCTRFLAEKLSAAIMLRKCDRIRV